MSFFFAKKIIIMESASPTHLDYLWTKLKKESASPTHLDYLWTKLKKEKYKITIVR